MIEYGGAGVAALIALTLLFPVHMAVIAVALVSVGIVIGRRS